MNDWPDPAGKPVTPMQVEARLRQLGRELDDAVKPLNEADAEYQEAKTAFEMAYARAAVGADGRNAEERKAAAALATEEEKWRLTLTEVKVSTMKRNIQRLERHVEIARSVGRLVMASMDGV